MYIVLSEFSVWGNTLAVVFRSLVKTKVKEEMRKEIQLNQKVKHKMYTATERICCCEVFPYLNCWGKGTIFQNKRNQGKVNLHLTLVGLMKKIAKNNKLIAAPTRDLLFRRLKGTYCSFWVDLHVVNLFTPEVAGLCWWEKNHLALDRVKAIRRVTLRREWVKC